jgi:hypothetical protein
MKNCYLCAADSEIHEEMDGFFVQCSGECGPYMITSRAIGDLNKIPGRKQSAVDRVKLLRQQDKTRRIRIDHDSVSFLTG